MTAWQPSENRMFFQYSTEIKERLRTSGLKVFFYIELQRDYR